MLNLSELCEIRGVLLLQQWTLAAKVPAEITNDVRADYLHALGLLDREIEDGPPMGWPGKTGPTDGADHEINE